MGERENEIKRRTHLFFRRSVSPKLKSEKDKSKCHDPTKLHKPAHN